MLLPALKVLAKAGRRVGHCGAQKPGGRHEARRRMLLRGGALRGRGRAIDAGAVPLPRMPVHHRRLAQHVEVGANYPKDRGELAGPDSGGQEGPICDQYAPFSLVPVGVSWGHTRGDKRLLFVINTRLLLLSLSGRLATCGVVTPPAWSPSVPRPLGTPLPSGAFGGPLWRPACSVEPFCHRILPRRPIQAASRPWPGKD
jgi:hypothetical protein